MAYLSTSSYMRQMMGTEKTKKYGDPTGTVHLYPSNDEFLDFAVVLI